MIPYDVDPSLHTAEPEPQRLDDGFSPRIPEAPLEGVTVVPHAPLASADALGEKSAF